MEDPTELMIAMMDTLYHELNETRRDRDALIDQNEILRNENDELRAWLRKALQ